MIPRFYSLAMCALALLAACATPREACLNDAAGPWRSAIRERDRIGRDLARGYTFETRFERRRVRRLCHAPNGGHFPCWDMETQPVTRREPVDRVALIARSAALERALPTLRRDAARDQAQCRAIYPPDSDA